MATSLDLDFDHLTLGSPAGTPIKNADKRSHSLSLETKDHATKLLYSTMLIRNIHCSNICKCKILKRRKSKHILKPARLRAPILNKSYERKIVLKPAILHSRHDEKNIPQNKVSKDIIKIKAMPAITTGKILNTDKYFKTFSSTKDEEDDEIVKAFDSLSFKRIQSAKVSKLPATNILGMGTNKDKTSSNHMCSLQAHLEKSLTTSCCDDTTIGELASYFDLFVHIPKKMSTMAEMMYI